MRVWPSWIPWNRFLLLLFCMLMLLHMIIRKLLLRWVLVPLLLFVLSKVSGKIGVHWLFVELLSLKLLSTMLWRLSIKLSWTWFLRSVGFRFLLVVSSQHKASELLVGYKIKGNKLEEIFEIFVSKISVIDALELAIFIDTSHEFISILSVITFHYSFYLELSFFLSI